MDNIMKFDVQEGRSMAWHSKTRINPELSIENCWLNKWDIEAKGLTLPSGVVVPFSVLVATDEPGLVIGSPYNPATYKPVTNLALLKQVKKGIEDEKKHLVLSSCGSVRNRARVFLSFALGEAYKAAGRMFKPFLNIGDSRDKSSPLWVNTSNTCTVCDNTFIMNMLSAGIMGVKHTKFSPPKIATLGGTIAKGISLQSEFAVKMEALGLVPVSADEALAFTLGVLGTPRMPASVRLLGIGERVVALFRGGAGNEGKNAADLFQAITDYYTHEAASAAADDAAKWKNFVSSEFGSGAERKTEMWNALNNEAKRAAYIEIGKDILSETRKADAVKAKR